jgi:deoxyxylulose-5-phosphate synthase
MQNGYRNKFSNYPIGFGQNIKKIITIILLFEKLGLNYIQEINKYAP